MSYADTSTGEVIEIKAIPIGLIDNGPLVRSETLNHDHACTLQESIDKLPNIKVRIAGDRYELIDGRHRLAAHKFEKRDTITAEVYDLDDRTHWLMAVEANIAHGRGLSLTERRDNAKRTIEIAPDLSNREIGRRCGLDHKTVGKIRPEPEGGRQHRGGEFPHLADRAGEAEFGDGSEGAESLPSSPAPPSSDDLSDIPEGSHGAPLESGEGQGTAALPSPDLSDLLPEHTADIDEAAFQSQVSKAISDARRSLLTFDPADVGVRADAENWEQLRALATSLSTWFSATKEARPSGLRVINGGQQ